VRASTLTLGAALLGLVSFMPLGLHVALADAAANRRDVIPLRDVKPGMKGYGLTVFQGTQPERFEVEVIDVLKNFLPRQDLILIKTKHPRLEVAKVVAGMSGSPVYLGGKMAGAYAYGWTFGMEPVAGVTPIANMLQDLDQPLPKEIDGWPLGPLPQKHQRLASRAGSSGRYAGPLERYDLRTHAAQIARNRTVSAASAPLAPVATPLLLGGITPRATEFARELLGPLGFEPLQAGGGGEVDPKSPTRFVDGGAIAVQMVRGDMSATPLGTVTRVEGNKLVAFGHPMMQVGVTALPTALGRILWVLASAQRSFKMGVATRPVGALVNDRQASIVVSQSQPAPLIPVRMRISGVPGARQTIWNFEVAHDKFNGPMFVAMALGSALQATASEHQDVSYSAKSRLKIQRYGEIEIEDYGVAVGGTPQPNDFANSNLVRALGATLNSLWEPVIIERVSMDIELRFAREILRLRGVELLEPEVDAGRSAHLRLTFVPYAGPPVVRTVAVPIPKHLAGKQVTLDLTPGYTEFKERADPDSLTALIQNLEDATYPPKSLVISYSTGAGGVAYKGHVVPSLPPGALDAIQPNSSSVAPSPFRTQTRHVVPLPEFMVGRDSVSLTVKPVLR
jgi:hypothetical protein